MISNSVGLFCDGFSCRNHSISSTFKEWGLNLEGFPPSQLKSWIFKGFSNPFLDSNPIKVAITPFRDVELYKTFTICFSLIFAFSFFWMIGEMWLYNSLMLKVAWIVRCLWIGSPFASSSSQLASPSIFTLLLLYSLMKVFKMPICVPLEKLYPLDFSRRATLFSRLRIISEADLRGFLHLV